jgi:hypothetical protein
MVGIRRKSILAPERIITVQNIVIPLVVPTQSAYMVPSNVPVAEEIGNAWHQYEPSTTIVA